MHNALSHSVRALEELVEAMNVFSEVEKSISSVPELIGRCQTLCASASVWRDGVSKVLQSSQSIAPSVLLQGMFLSSWSEDNMILKLYIDEYDVVADAARYLSELPRQLEEMLAACPQLTYILQPTQEWIRQQGYFSFSQLVQPLPEGDSVEDVDNLIDTLLIMVQSMLRQCSLFPEPTPESEEVKDNYIRLGVQTTSLFTTLLDLSALGDQLNSAGARLSSLPHASRQRALRRVTPFLSCFLSFAGELLESLARWTRALFKLDYVVCSVVHTLGMQGFCIPPETEEGEATGDEKGHATELGGTGLGEGTGNENVSKEIEDESQVEGLRGDDDGDEEMQREKGKDEENTIEMSEDFGGEMEDVPEAEEGDENEDAEEEEGEEPDEQLGKLDKSDPAAVDEKLWGDEGGKDDGKGENELQNDRSQENQQKDSDIVAKEGKSENENDEKKAKDVEEEGEGDERDEPEEVDAGDENLAEEVEPPNASGAPMDQHIPDADTLDLPDDMHLDENQDKQEDHEDDLGMEDLSDDEHGADDQMDEDEDEAKERERDHTPKDDPMSIEPQDNEQQPPRAVDESSADEEKDNSDEESENKAVARPDLTAGDGDAGTSENEPQPKDSAQEGQQSSASTQVDMDVDGGESSREIESRKQQ